MCDKLLKEWYNVLIDRVRIIIAEYGDLHEDFIKEDTKLRELGISGKKLDHIITLLEREFNVKIRFKDQTVSAVEVSFQLNNEIDIEMDVKRKKPETVGDLVNIIEDQL